MTGRGAWVGLVAMVGCSAGTLGGESANSLGGSSGDIGPPTTTAVPQSTSGGVTGPTTSTPDPTQTSTTAGSSTTASSSTGTVGESSSTGEGLPVLASCADLLAFEPTLSSDVYSIDPDGPGEITGLDVYCEMELHGGGWTLVMVSSDDGGDTWTYADRALMTTNETAVGDVDERDRDYKSLALHRLAFADLLFVHQPSGVWAAYEGLGAGGADLGTFMAGQPDPHCDANAPGNGIPMTGGTLTVLGNLCDTDLYFHVGDWDGIDVAACANAARTFNNTTYGPTWNAASNGGCPFDDPVNAALGPSIQCNDCPAGTDQLEVVAVGFGGPAMLNTGDPGTGENHMQIYVR